jgi:hypothetical protein
MKKFKGTQGEWGCSEIMNFSGTLVSYINTNKKEIAQLRGCETGQEDEAMANAKLIAAAPELLKALQMVTKAFDNKLIDSTLGNDFNVGGLLYTIEAAINKALK